ncbi:MAG: HEAT repeat domain-containing protein, partial [Gemmataceae bacterium]
MTTKRVLIATAAMAGTALAVHAQFPGLTPPTSSIAPPIATVPPPPLPTGIAPYPGLPEGPTIWSKLGISQAQREFCRRKTCRTPMGQMMARIINPISGLTGGLISPFCPTTPSLAELQDPGAVGAAAKVKQDRAGAEERIKAVRYLGGVDCHYWPEAEEALIGALRNDRNECVRYEAALVLGKGCCCTCKVIVALSHAVSCSDKDGAPWEKSARVRSAAAVALEHCLQ